MPKDAPKAAKPTKEIFDPFNSSATGHQRAENRLSGSTLWRDSRHRKLREQFSSGAGGGKRVSDTVGGGAVGELNMGLETSGKITWFRAHDQPSLQETLKVTKDVERPAKRLKSNEYMINSAMVGEIITLGAKKHSNSNQMQTSKSPDLSPSHFLSPIDLNTALVDSSPAIEEPIVPDIDSKTSQKASPPQIFDRLTIYINGSTAPLISDHKLKRVLTEHGANMSISLGRRTVTHVILGRPTSSSGAGGGLSGSKIQKEIASKQAECVKYVTAEWVTESVKAGKRLPEGRFKALRLAPKGVASVASMFATQRKEASGKVDKAGEG